MITEKEKLIYNSYLYASRSVKNQPVRLRQNFDKLDSRSEVALKKLSLFLSKYNHINYNDYFISPYKIYGADNYFDIQFFNTRKAMKCYSMYCKEKELQNPDSEDSINTLKDCLKFIYDYCCEHKITLSKYKTATSIEVEAIPYIFKHLKNHKINFYTLHSLNVESLIQKQDNEIIDWIINDFANIYSKTRVKFITSKVLKEKARKGIKIIEEQLNNRYS